MQWIDQYQLFLFDFDGLLVNTEKIHYQAYINMCKNRGYEFDLDFPSYCKIAHYSSEGLSETIYQKFPRLKEEVFDWNVLYREKTEAYLELLRTGPVELMPGVEELLKALEEKDVKRCVVTHSMRELVMAIRKINPILDSIPHWITREDYNHPKPDPDSYLTAVKKFAGPEDKIIGFEDTPRGMTALLHTRAKPILIAPLDYPEINDLKKKGVEHYPSFPEFFEVMKSPSTINNSL